MALIKLQINEEDVYLNLDNVQYFHPFKGGGTKIIVGDRVVIVDNSLLEIEEMLLQIGIETYK